MIPCLGALLGWHFKTSSSHPLTEYLWMCMCVTASFSWCWLSCSVKTFFYYGQFTDGGLFVICLRSVALKHSLIHECLKICAVFEKTDSYSGAALWSKRRLIQKSGYHCSHLSVWCLFIHLYIQLSLLMHVEIISHKSPKSFNTICLLCWWVA